MGVFGSDVVFFAVIGLPLLDTTLTQVLVSSLWGISIVVLILAAGKATGCNPADAHILGKSVHDVDLETRYCFRCKSTVFAHSRHCYDCDKCVFFFDHHCKWLNNCVGRSNYCAFATSISSVIVMTGIIIGCCVKLLILDPVDFRGRFGETPQPLMTVLLWVMVTINLVLFLLDLQLVLLHLFLTHQHLSTHEYIIHKRNLREWAKEVSEQEADPNKCRLKRDIRTLPHCMDWIIFCGGRHKKRPQSSVDHSQAPNGISPSLEWTGSPPPGPGVDDVSSSDEVSVRDTISVTSSWEAPKGPAEGHDHMLSV